VHVFPDNSSQTVVVKLKSGKKNINGKVRLDIPDGWKSKPLSYDYSILEIGQEQSFEFTITPPPTNSKVEAKAIATFDGKDYNKSLITLEYDHIPTQVMFEKASAELVRIELEKRGEKIGYIMGAGDAIPEALVQIGYKVDQINGKEWTQEFLQQYDAIILGVRALNTENQLTFDMAKLLNYVENGGTLMLQYNTNFSMVTDAFSPYELKISRDRVTVEEAEITFINPDHPALNIPNKITQKDFEGWSQERGLYFPESWGEQFEAVISTHDPGEKPLDGGILIAKYGKGYYVYSSLSWFRELPVGVPGAYRLFTNLISIGKE
jgi:hypothetical protein